MNSIQENRSLVSVHEDGEPLPAGRRLVLRLALGLGLLPLLAACSDDDDDSNDEDGFGAVSDIRLKEGITRIGTTVHGLPYYSFSYAGKPEVYAGVMAQDVLAVMPEAVHLLPSGFYAVRYKKLGLRMLRLQ